MAYELNLRTGESGLEPGAILPRVAELLALPALEEGAAELSFLEGETRLTLREARGEDEQGLGADLVLPYGAVITEIEDCLKKSLDAAGKARLVVFDPQLGSAVARGDLGRILDRYREDSAYHVHLSGTAEDLRQGISSAREASPYQQPRASVQVKIILGLIALFFLLWLLFRFFVISPMIRQLEGDEAARIPQTGPPPGWVARHPPRVDPPATDPDEPPPAD
ncbi:MAG: hypothetical protein P1V51_14125 [Deltaproteobacteria bacterium]|nr:hypothetical protein [Deltaproteobacteria bacterium]